MRPGIHTTEFWVTLLVASACALCTLLYFASPPTADLAWPTLARGIALAVYVLGTTAVVTNYLEGRNRLKSLDYGPAEPTGGDDDPHDGEPVPEVAPALKIFGFHGAMENWSDREAVQARH